MKRSLIWIAVGAAVIGVGVPAYAAVQAGKPHPSITTVNTTVEDVSGNCDEAEHASDPNCFTTVVPVSEPTTLATQPSISVDNSTENSIDDDATDNSIDDDNATDNSIDDATENSVDDATSNSVDDISGPCDEAEHANDPRCTGTQVTVNSVDDNSDSGRGSDHSDDDSDDDNDDDDDDDNDDNSGSGHGSDD